MNLLQYTLLLLITLISSATSASSPVAEEPHGELASKLEAAGYVNVRNLDPSIKVALMYATPDNFVGEVMYDDLTQAYLHPDAAQALVKAQQELHRLHPGYNLLIKDASRPMSVQQKMYNTVRGTNKARYVSNPANGGGMHNYGVAVDITIVDSLGIELPMGTPVDHLGPEAGINREAALVRAGKLTADDVANRRLLRRVMRAGGFTPLSSEWWHFNLVSRPVAKSRYKVIDF